MGFEVEHFSVQTAGCGIPKKFPNCPKFHFLLFWNVHVVGTNNQILYSKYLARMPCVEGVQKGSIIYHFIFPSLHFSVTIIHYLEYPFFFPYVSVLEMWSFPTFDTNFSSPSYSAKYCQQSYPILRSVILNA